MRKSFKKCKILDWRINQSWGNIWNSIHYLPLVLGFYHPVGFLREVPAVLLLRCLSLGKVAPPLVRGMGSRWTGHLCRFCFLVAFHTSSEGQSKNSHARIFGPEARDHSSPSSINSPGQIISTSVCIKPTDFCSSPPLHFSWGVPLVPMSNTSLCVFATSTGCELTHILLCCSQVTAGCHPTLLSGTISAWELLSSHRHSLCVPYSTDSGNLHPIRTRGCSKGPRASLHFVSLWLWVVLRSGTDPAPLLPGNSWMPSYSPSWRHYFPESCC